jgi:PGF-pre-PGF domain-containing protein
MEINRRKGLVIVIVAAAASMFYVGQAGAVTQIDNCTAIPSPGEYVLNQSINGTGYCIEITSSDVIFDGAGYTINGLGGGTKGVYVYNSTTALTNITVKNLNVTGWYYGIYYSNAANGRIENNSVLNNTQWDFYSESNSINNVVINLTIIPTISFNSKDVAIRSATSPAGDPIGCRNISKYIDAADNSADSWLFLNMSYSDSDVSGLNESSLRMWRYDGSWSQVSDPNGVDTAQNYVYANITNFSIFAPMAVILDTTPPASITSLINSTYEKTFINWTWTDPSDADVSHVSIWMDNMFKTNVSKGIQFYNATNLTPDTEYTIATRTVDTNGNVNTTWVNYTARTAIPVIPIVITITSPANNSVNTTGDVNVTVTLDRQGTAILNWEGANESMDGAGTGFYKNKTGLLSGNYSFWVNASDMFGHFANVSETRTVTVDLTKNVPLPIDPETGNLSETINIASPSGNVMVTILNGTNATNATGATLRNISIDSPDALPLTLVAKLSPNDRLMGENLSLGPDGARFKPNITARFNYTKAQLPPGTSDSDVTVKFYNNDSGQWEALPIVDPNFTSDPRYVNVSISHFSFYWIGVTIPQTTPPRTVSGGGGEGGSGVITSEPSDNIAKSDRDEKNLIGNTSVTYTFTMPEHGIYELAVTGKETENNIAIRIEALKGTSKRVTASPPGTVYKNVNIWTNTKQIKEVLIRFKVENSWLDSSSLASSDIKMLKWDGSKWAQIETAEKTKDSVYTCYEAKTFALSHFAVTGLKEAVVKAAPTVTITPPRPTPAVTVVQHEEEGKPQMNWALIIGVLVVIGIAIVLYLKRK